VGAAVYCSRHSLCVDFHLHVVLEVLLASSAYKPSVPVFDKRIGRPRVCLAGIMCLSF